MYKISQKTRLSTTKLPEFELIFPPTLRIFSEIYHRREVIILEHQSSEICSILDRLGGGGFMSWIKQSAKLKFSPLPPPTNCTKIELPSTYVCFFLKLAVISCKFPLVLPTKSRK